MPSSREDDVGAGVLRRSAMHARAEDINAAVAGDAVDDVLAGR
jgi:hypothetical protein